LRHGVRESKSEIDDYRAAARRATAASRAARSICPARRIAGARPCRLRSGQLASVTGLRPAPRCAAEYLRAAVGCRRGCLLRNGRRGKLARQHGDVTGFGSAGKFCAAAKRLASAPAGARPKSHRPIMRAPLVPASPQRAEATPPTSVAFPSSACRKATDSRSDFAKWQCAEVRQSPRCGPGSLKLKILSSAFVLWAVWRPISIRLSNFYSHSSTGQRVMHDHLPYSKVNCLFLVISKSCWKHDRCSGACGP